LNFATKSKKARKNVQTLNEVKSKQKKFVKKFVKVSVTPPQSTVQKVVINFQEGRPVCVSGKRPRSKLKAAKYRII